MGAVDLLGLAGMTVRVVGERQRPSDVAPQLAVCAVGECGLVCRTAELEVRNRQFQVLAPEAVNRDVARWNAEDERLQAGKRGRHVLDGRPNRRIRGEVPGAAILDHVDDVQDAQADDRVGRVDLPSGLERSDPAEPAFGWDRVEDLDVRVGRFDVVGLDLERRGVRKVLDVGRVGRGGGGRRARRGPDARDRRRGEGRGRKRRRGRRHARRDSAAGTRHQRQAEGEDAGEEHRFGRRHDGLRIGASRGSGEDAPPQMPAEAPGLAGRGRAPVLWAGALERASRRRTPTPARRRPRTPCFRSRH
jgi:hypothetical protein